MFCAPLEQSEPEQLVPFQPGDYRCSQERRRTDEDMGRKGTPFFLRDLKEMPQVIKVIVLHCLGLKHNRTGGVNGTKTKLYSTDVISGAICDWGMYAQCKGNASSIQCIIITTKS